MEQKLQTVQYLRPSYCRRQSYQTNVLRNWKENIIDKLKRNLTTFEHQTSIMFTRRAKQIGSPIPGCCAKT
eukprot:364869-Chlamydomonas_euryale.AAC.15